MATNDRDDAVPGEGQPRPDGELFRLAVQQEQDYAILLLDAAGRIVSSNAGVERIDGYSADDLIGQHVGIFYPRDDVEAGKPQRAFEAARDFGQFEEEGWRVRRDGSQYLACTSVTALWDGGTLRGYSFITRDMTAQRTGEDRVQSIVDNVIDGIITIDDRGAIGTFNQAAEKLFGYAADEVIGQNVRLLMPEPFHSEHDSYIANYLRTGRAKIIGIGREVVGRRKDGSTFPMDLAVGEFHLHGRRYFTGVVRDVTERKEAEQALRQKEERIRSIVDHVIDGIITIDEKGTIDTMNPAAERLFGYASDEVIGQNVKLLMPEPYRSEHDTYLANYLRTGEAKIIGIGREVVGRRKDGTTFPMDLAVGQFHLGDRRFFTGIVRDITDRKRLEAELHERVEQLAEADRRKDEFLAMLAHELRNPLAPIRNALYLMHMPDVDESIHHSARQVMERQVEQMVRLVDDLLDVSRIMRGKIALKKEPVELARIVEQAVETVRPVIDAQGHQLTISLPGEPVWLDADVTRLSQVVGNLLNNAAKFTPSAGRIDLAATTEGNAAVVRVRDEGAGIPPDMLGRIFELFVQAEQGRDRAQGGLGIGLTLVKQLTELHGGQVDAFSEGPGRGSEFVLRLPLLVTAPAASEEDSRRQLRPRRILVVDDNVDSAHSLGMLLQAQGHEVRIAYSGPAALEIAAAARPQIVLLDIGMPGMDGFEVARRMRNQLGLNDALLVAVTGWGTAADRQLSAAAGFDLHWVKPVRPTALETLETHPKLD